MSFHMDRVAPEKQTRPLPSIVFLAGDERTIMKLPTTYATEVFVNGEGTLSILQNIDNEGDVIVALSREQARLVAVEIMRLDGDDSAWEVKEDH